MSSKTMQIRFFDPGKSYLKIKDEVDAEMQRVLTAGDLILREDVEKFENNFAEFVGKKYAVGLNSGTDALYLALKAVGVGPGDKVMTRSHTFVATVQVIKQIGAEPLLLDFDEAWSNHDYYLPVHLAGQVDVSPTTGDIIEDACQALGAQGVGYGNIQCYSFYPAKILGAYGDAGAITTDDEDIYNEIKELRNHYKKDYSDWGINSRLDNLQAAILNVKLKYLPQLIIRRKAIADYYLDQFKHFPAFLPTNTPGRVWQDFIFRTPKRDALFNYLKIHGIETMKNEYPMPIPKLPKAAQYEKETLRLPINETLTDEEIKYVVDKVKKFYEL